MPAPEITFTVSGNKVSDVSGFDHISVSFYSDLAYTQCEVRATRIQDAYGRGVGRLVAAFSATPAATSRTFEVYDTDLVNGEGEYRISIYAEGQDGGWNDNHGFIPFGIPVYDEDEQVVGYEPDGGLITSDGQEFLCMR